MDRGASLATVHGVTEIRNDQTHTEHTHTHTHTYTQKHKFSYTLKVNQSVKCSMNNLSF